MDINQYSIKVYKQNVKRGWWDNPKRCIYQTLQLVNTEFAEATEGDRKNLMDDHLPHRKMVEVEMADALIRLLDLAGRYGWLYEERPASQHLADYESAGSALFFLTALNCSLGAAVVRGCGPDILSKIYSQLVEDIIFVCGKHELDLNGAVDEKLKYNATRPDHDREARKAEYGKKY